MAVDVCHLVAESGTSRISVPVLPRVNLTIPHTAGTHRSQPFDPSGPNVPTIWPKWVKSVCPDRSEQRAEELVEAKSEILKLRADVEKQLQANKYYVAMNKLDELLAAIRPLEVVEAVVETPRQEAEPAPAAEPARSWSGIVRETVVEGEAASPS